LCPTDAANASASLTGVTDMPEASRVRAGLTVAESLGISFDQVRGISLCIGFNDMGKLSALFSC
jgi:hypothetical protein